MNAIVSYSILLNFIFIVSPLIFLTLLFITAPYGRHSKSGWGFMMDNRLAWMLMELPAVLTIMIVYLYYREDIHPASIVFLMIWEWHYIYRTFYYPSQLQKTQRSFPFLLVLFATVFNVINGYINGVFLFDIRPINDASFFTNPHFIVGLIIFFTGFVIHFQSDRIIINLRTNTEVKYSIPYGGLFKYVTNPNYFGEFVQWSGWAILTWSAAGAAFALFTLCNLLPRAIANHKWYKNKFADYPAERKVFFPYLF